ncbi:hypothetical protein C8F01DRAFT_1318653, partial [Mycena amicta]
KTSLTRAVIHHSAVAARYGDQRFFVACESAASKDELVSLTAAYLGLNLDRDPTRQILQHLSKNEGLLVLDNLETCWEAAKTRKDVEEFLSALTDVTGLALIVTMLGSERPANVRWTRPFLPPLEPLTHAASRQVFLDITEEVTEPAQIDRLLQLTDNIPLVIDLIAHAVDCEMLDGSDTDAATRILSRWETENVMLSAGFDKRSNLDISISLSLSSPRFTALPGPILLLTLLSVLPDGLSDAELLESGLPIENVLSCKETLLRTSLGYTTGNVGGRRLRVLSPIREYMQRHHPLDGTPGSALAEPLFQLYYRLLVILDDHGWASVSAGAGIPMQLRTSFANVRSLITFRLSFATMDSETQVDQQPTIRAGAILNAFNRIMGLHSKPLLLDLPDEVRSRLSEDHEVGIALITAYLSEVRYFDVENLEELIDRGKAHLPFVKDSSPTARFFNHVANRYETKKDMPKALEFAQKALDVCKSTSSTTTAILRNEFHAYCMLFNVKIYEGAFSLALTYANECERTAKLFGSLLMEADVYRMQALCYQNMGFYRQAIARYREARDLVDQCGLAGGHMDQLIASNLGETYKRQTDYARSLEIQKKLLLDDPMENDVIHMAFVYMSVAELHVAMGAPREEGGTAVH